MEIGGMQPTDTNLKVNLQEHLVNEEEKVEERVGGRSLRMRRGEGIRVEMHNFKGVSIY